MRLLENLKLDEMVEKRAYEFAFVVQPLRIEGGRRLDGGAGARALSINLSYVA